MRYQSETFKSLDIKDKVAIMNRHMIIERFNEKPPKYVQSCDCCGDKFKLTFLDPTISKPRKDNQDLQFYDTYSCDCCNQVYCAGCMIVVDERGKEFKSTCFDCVD